VNIENDRGTDDDELASSFGGTQNVKVHLPGSLHHLLHQVKLLEGTTISEQVRWALLEYYDQDPEDHPAVSDQSRSEDGPDRDAMENVKSNTFDEPTCCRHGCGYETTWRTALTTHQRHRCPDRPEVQNKTQDEIRAERESTAKCPVCEASFHTREHRPVLYKHKNRKTGDYPCDGSGAHPELSENVRCQRCGSLCWAGGGDAAPAVHEDPATGEDCPGSNEPGATPEDVSSCPLCDAGFGTHDALRLHLQAQHELDQPEPGAPVQASNETK
jgi:hypothetical protein